jgi:hypothetical protein
MERIVPRSAPPMATEGGWSLVRWFLVTFGAIAAGLIFMGREYYFGTALFETGDLAANSIQIIRATHLLEIYGNYSRFEFHHPGPAFFYVYGAGETVFFNLLHLVPAPHNGHLLAGALLQSAFLATAIAVIARFAAPNRGLFVGAAIAVALVHFGMAGNPEFSLWPPEQLVVPFACFVVVAIAVACGWISLLPLLVLCGGFLVHGHVAQPLYVVPMASLACLLGFWRSFQRADLGIASFIRGNSKSYLVALAILGIFVAPLLLDATRGPDSNLVKIFTNLNAPRASVDVHSRTQLLAYVFSFLGYPADLEVLSFSGSQLGSFVASHWAGLLASVSALVFLPVALLVAHRSRRSSIDAIADSDSPLPAGSQFFVTYYLFLAIAIVATLVWVSIQKGPLYEFNSFFVYGLMYAAVLPPLMSVCRRWPIRKAPLSLTLVGVLALGLTVSTELRIPVGEDPGGLALNNAANIVIASRTSHDAVMLEFEAVDWPQATGIALALQRSNVPWFVEPQWGFMFGRDHVHVRVMGSASGVETWFLTPPARGHDGQMVLTSRIAIYPPPPSLSSYPSVP